MIDGDTLELDDGSRVRLVQIDAPESKGECYGRKAGLVLRKLLPVGSVVRLQPDRRLDNRDRYERLLRYVFKGGKNVDLLLVKRGAASVWYYQGDRGRYADELSPGGRKGPNERARSLGSLRRRANTGELVRPTA